MLEFLSSKNFRILMLILLTQLSSNGSKPINPTTLTQRPIATFNIQSNENKIDLSQTTVVNGNIHITNNHFSK